MRSTVLAAFALTGALVASGADAHAHLLSSTPAVGATIASPAAITMSFSEKLARQFSGLALSDAKGKPVALVARPTSDPKSLTAGVTAPLKPGLYTVTWHAVSADTHRVQGHYVFMVK